MAKYELRTKKTESRVEDFLNSIPDEQKRRDCYVILDLMKKTTKSEPKMWGSAIIGFGDVHYKYASGHEGDICKIGFSPRKQSISLYLMCGIPAVNSLLTNLGKYKTGKGCLYINKISDVDIKVLKEIILTSFNKRI
jgi:hypothetical protein